MNRSFSSLIDSGSEVGPKRPFPRPAPVDISEVPEAAASLLFHLAEERGMRTRSLRKRMAIIRVVTSVCWLGDVGTAAAEHRGADGKVTTQEQFVGMAGSRSKHNVLGKQSNVRGLLNKR